VFAPSALAGKLDTHAILPGDAIYTGIHRGSWQIWYSPHQVATRAYIVGSNRVESWPRLTDITRCK
jgi:hypothetical protein